MTTYAHFKFSFLFIFFFGYYIASAQYSIENLDLDGDIYDWHDQAITLEKTGLVLGEYQEVKRMARDSHQFFEKDVWTPNTLRYRGEIFDSVYLMYDIYNDVMVMRHPTQLQYQSQPIKPIQSQVGWFTLAGHTFAYYPQKILYLSPGFYDQLYVGEQFELIVKRIKESRAESSLIFVPSDVYVVRFQDEFHRMRRKGSILRLFNDRKDLKKKVKQFIKDNNLRVSHEYEQDLIMLAQYCDELLKAQ